jgi:hypothetical protein
MDLYHIYYSVIKHKYAGITDQRNALAVDHKGWLDQVKVLQISF